MWKSFRERDQGRVRSCEGDGPGHNISLVDTRILLRWEYPRQCGTITFKNSVDRKPIAEAGTHVNTCSYTKVRVKVTVVREDR